MVIKNQHSRRKFIGALALGATASAMSALTGPISTSSLSFDDKKLNDAEKWIEGIKGKHRIAYDGSTPHDGFPIIWNWAFYHTNNLTGVPDEEITAMTVIRHSAIAFALKSSLWKKYKLGEFFEINDNSTGKPSLRNPMYEPQEGDMPMPPIQGIKDLQARGAMFCVCNLALNVYAGFIAPGMNMTADAVYKEFLEGVHPGIQVVPSGVWALGRAQEKGCGYIFAGN